MWFFLVMERKKTLRYPTVNKKIPSQEEPNDPFEFLPYLAVSVYKCSEYKFGERIYKFRHGSKGYKKLYLFYHGISKIWFVEHGSVCIIWQWKILPPEKLAVPCKFCAITYAYVVPSAFQFVWTLHIFWDLHPQLFFWASIQVL